jgi:hypothetical protein
MEDMLKYLFAFIIFIHGLIHMMGFAKAYGYGNLQQLTKDISKPVGSIWFFACLLFIIAVIGFLLAKEWWPVLALFAVLVSQVVIIMSWKDAKFGTIANVLVLIVAILSITAIHFEKTFRADVKQQFISNNNLAAAQLTEDDLMTLPAPVQKYLRYAGVLNKPKVKNVRIVFDGEMRSKGKDWFKFSSVQYNFFFEPTRLFFMKGKMFGITVPGYHHYIQNRAVMDIRLFGLFPMVQQAGAEMNKAETVTLFNDMCLMAPATLIDKRIKWIPIDDKKTQAIFTNGNITISAILHFNERGQLINFTSTDRYDVNGKQSIPFSTPVHEYKNFNGYNLLYKGDAVWHYPDGEFVYGKFILKEIKYNLEEFEN